MLLILSHLDKIWPQKNVCLTYAYSMEMLHRSMIMLKSVSKYKDKQVFFTDNTTPIGTLMSLAVGSSDSIIRLKPSEFWKGFQCLV